MAETSRLLSPDKTVLIPDLRAGCSLAASITAEDVRQLRRRYPGVPVVSYVNTSADVKAASDICCTSGNALRVVESLGSERVIFVPDGYRGRHVARQSEVDIIFCEGACEVHKRFTAAEIRDYRAQFDSISVIAHPEGPPDVLAEAGFVGSTQSMIDWVAGKQPERVVMVTECSMSDNVSVEHPEVEFVRPCNLCPHMKRITLRGILHSLETRTHEVHIASAARSAVKAMLQVESMRSASFAACSISSIAYAH